MWFTIFNPSWNISSAPVYIQAKKICNGRAIYYVTLEGIPFKHIAQGYGVKYVDYVTNSNFTKWCLEQVGMKVSDVVHHAINLDEVKRAKNMVGNLKAKIKNEFRDKIIFCYVGRDDHRKQLERLFKAVEILHNKYPNDFALLMHVEVALNRRPKTFFERPNTYIVSTFGSKPHKEVLAFMGACDFFVFPSVCEGFGVPVLETMAMGTPPIINKMPPLTEFTTKHTAIYYENDGMELWNTGAEQYFVMHLYDPKELAGAMEYAIDVYKNFKSKYEDLKAKAENHAKRWDYRKIYKKFVSKMSSNDNIKDISKSQTPQTLPLHNID